MSDLDTLLKAVMRMTGEALFLESVVTLFFLRLLMSPLEVVVPDRVSPVHQLYYSNTSSICMIVFGMLPLNIYLTDFWFVLKEALVV